MNRLRAGRIAVRGPLNPRRVTEFVFDPESLDCIVFWTKNPAPFLSYLPEIDSLGYRYYFQFTITPYGKDLERNLDKSHIYETFIRLSEMIGKERVIWRYDPIIVNGDYSIAFHAERFEEAVEHIGMYTEQCVISFVDPYHFLEGAFREAGIRKVTAEEMEEAAAAFCRAARKHGPGLEIASCCEGTGLAKYGIQRGECVDHRLIARITGKEMGYRKDPSQRQECGCTVSRDIGAYHTCRHGCVYCYARRGKRNDAPWDVDSRMLCDQVDPARDMVKVIDLRGLYAVKR